MNREQLDHVMFKKDFSKMYNECFDTTYYQLILTIRPEWAPNEQHIITVIDEQSYDIVNLEYSTITIMSQQQNYTTIDLSEEHMTLSDFLEIW